MDYSSSRQGEVAGCFECGNELWVTYNAVNYLTILGPFVFLARTLLH
jgi:hypothetical protein